MCLILFGFLKIYRMYLEKFWGEMNIFDILFFGEDILLFLNILQLFSLFKYIIFIQNHQRNSENIHFYFILWIIYLQSILKP